MHTNGDRDNKVLVLPDGRTSDIRDWSYMPLRSAFVVTPYTTSMDWDLFGYARSSDLPSDPGVKATRAHTNLPRSGNSGLPKDWEMLVSRWRATMSEPLAQPVVDFASECSVRFKYNEHELASATLAELVLGALPIEGDRETGKLPVCMREQVSFSVEVSCGSREALEALQQHMRGPSTVDPGIAAELEQLERLAPQPIGQELRRIRAKLMPGRRLTCWVALEGLLKRVVV